MEAAFRIIKGNSVNMDLTEITFEYEPAKKVYSFLSFAWSIFADIDIGSEAIRCCGPTRFTVWGVWRCLFRRDYFGSLRYIGERANSARGLQKRNKRNSNQEEVNLINKSSSGGMSFKNAIESQRDDLEEKLSPEPIDIREPGKIVNQNFRFFVAMNTPFASTDIHLAPLSDVDDGFNDLVML